MEKKSFETSYLQVIGQEFGGLKNISKGDIDFSSIINRLTLLGIEKDTAKNIIAEVRSDYEKNAERDNRFLYVAKRVLNKKLIEYGFLTPINITENAMKVLEKRYLKKDDDGNVIETPEELFYRVASFVAGAERKFNRPDAEQLVEEYTIKFYEIMSQLEFLPNSPTLMNAGRELGQLSACFVLPVEDSMESIFTALKNTALIHKSGGGTGFSFSRIRPQNDVVASTKGVSSGPLSFMKVFDVATETIKQGGTRRGANMGILSVDHPDILKFIEAKAEDKIFNNFNISVALTEDFMKAVMNNESYELINPRTKQVAGKLNARMVFDKIVYYAWKNGEPGIIFLDRINAANPTPHIGMIESTNPCGEQPLLPYESCNLGSINLSLMVRDGKVDFDRLSYVVRVATRFLDNVIEVNKYPVEEIEKMTKGNRKIGLGVMGFADMLIKLGVQYDSFDALGLAEQVMNFINRESKLESARLAEERGEFPNFKGSIYDRPGFKPLRNATTTTIAPTGTISIIAGTSSGIEPLFAIAYVRNVMDNTKLYETNPLFLKVAKEEGFYSEELIAAIAEKGSLAEIEGIPQRIKRIFRTAHDISPEWHVRMQAAFQKYVDNAVSKTVNLPHNATQEDVKDIYLLAYKLNCKGVTVYRDGSREDQVLSTKKTLEAKQAHSKESAQSQRIIPRERPDCVWGMTQKLITGCGNIYVTVNEDEKGPVELFTAIGKAGGCASSQAEAISRLISLALRAGIDMESIIKQLQGVRCPNPQWFNGEKILSCSDAIARAMKSYLEKRGDLKKVGPASQAPEKSEVKKVSTRGNISSLGEKTSVSCPECGSNMVAVDGCFVCSEPTCGFSKCL